MALNIESVLHEKAKFLTKEETNSVNDMSAIVVFDGIAVVDEVKAKKLTLFLLKKIQPFGSVVHNDIYFPMDPETKMSLGMAILEMHSAEEAKKVIEGLNNTPMDRSHTFHLYRYADIVSVLNSSEEVALPEMENYGPLNKAKAVIENLHSWMEDPFQRDQYVIRYQKGTEVYWCDAPKPQPIESSKEEDLSASLDTIMWSPLGTYLATFHAKGIILHAGEEFKECGRLSHSNVQRLLFSSQERYAVTWNGELGLNNKDAILVWDVAAMHLLRRFPCTDDQWPSYVFSADEQFLATKGSNGIGIFALPSMQMLHKSCFGISNIKEFAWSPRGCNLAYMIPESNGKPATIVILDVQNNTRIQSASFTNVEGIVMKWSPKGDFLSIMVARYPKKKGKNISYQFSIIRLNDRNAPIDTIPVSETVKTIEWEPTGRRIAALTEDKNGNNNISIYNMFTHKGNEKVNEASLEFTISNKACNTLAWSPMGKYLLIAGLGSSLKGRLEFWDISTQSLLKEQEHFSCTNIAWSPNGHYCITSSCYNVLNKQDYENGYDVWNNRGEKVYSIRLPRFVSLQFRPWSLLCLSDAERKEVKRSLPVVSEKYRKQQEEMEALKHIDEIRMKLNAIDAFKERQKKMRDEMMKIDAERKKLFNVDSETVEITIRKEEVLEETEEVC